MSQVSDFRKRNIRVDQPRQLIDSFLASCHVCVAIAVSF